MPPCKYMVKYIKQKQQQKQQLQSFLPPELATLDTPLGGLPIIEAGLALLRVLEYRKRVKIAEVVSMWNQRARCSVVLEVCEVHLHRRNN